MRMIPCFLCGRDLRKRTDKNKKPYFVCDPCGTQIFIRRQYGIENLAQLIKNLEERDFHFRQRANELFELQALLAEIRGVKKEIAALDSAFELFASKKDRRQKERTRKSLDARVDALLSQLEKMTRRDAQSKKDDSQHHPELGIAL